MTWQVDWTGLPHSPRPYHVPEEQGGDRRSANSDRRPASQDVREPPVSNRAMRRRSAQSSTISSVASARANVRASASQAATNGTIPRIRPFLATRKALYVSDVAIGFGADAGGLVETWFIVGHSARRWTDRAPSGSGGCRVRYRELDRSCLSVALVALIQVTAASRPSGTKSAGAEGVEGRRPPDGPRPGRILRPPRERNAWIAAISPTPANRNSGILLFWLLTSAHVRRWRLQRRKRRRP